MNRVSRESAVFKTWVIFLSVSWGALFYSCPTFAFGKKPVAEKRPDSAISILAGFRGSCSSQGSQTAAANSQTDNLITIVETLKQTDACKPFVDQLTQIQTAANQLSSLQQSSAYQTYAGSQNSIQILTEALSQFDPSSQAATDIKSAIETSRLAMYSDEASYNVSRQSEQRDLIVSNSQGILSWGQQLVSSSSSSDIGQCLTQSPSAAIELGTNLFSMGGSFLSPVFGAAVSSIAQVVNIGMEAFRDGQYDSAINEAEADQMPDALNCALESMSDSYCTANDSYSLLELARENRDANYQSLPLWQGIDIVDRQLPGLLSWLDKIKNGVPPQDSSQASKQAAVLSEVLAVQQGDLLAVSVINNAVSQYQAAQDTATKKADFLQAVMGIAVYASGESTSTSTSTSVNPFATLEPNAFVWECWLINGYTIFNGYGGNCPVPTDNPSSGNPSITQLGEYIDQITNQDASIPQVVPLLLSNWKSTLVRVQNVANTDFARTITTNAGSLVSDAFEALDGNPLSPEQVLANISSFIQGMIDYNYKNNPQLPALLQLKKQNVDQAIQELTGPDSVICAVPPPGAPLDTAECENKRLIDLYSIFQLDNGSQVFGSDIQNLISTDLQNRFSSGEFPPSNAQVLEASGLDFAVRLQEAGFGDLDPMSSDLNNARGDYETNIRVFREFFVKGFSQAVQHESVLSQGEIQSDGPNRPHGQKLAQLCLFWLTTANIPGSRFQTDLNWPDTQTQQSCEKASYFNGNSNADVKGNFAPAFTITDLEKSLGSTPFQQRVCTFHNYKLKNEAATLYTLNK